MTYPDGGARSWRHFGLGPACVAAAVLLAMLGMMGGSATARAQDTQAEGEGSGTSVPPLLPTAQTPAETPVIDRPAEAKALTPDEGRQRRMLLLLLMNGAGPVRPFGNLGR